MAMVTARQVANGPTWARGVSSLCGMATLFAGCALCQPAWAEEGVELEEVIVTAQRREQNIRDIPIAIDAVLSEELISKAIEDVQRLAETLPSLTVGGHSQQSAGVKLFVRGIGSAVGDPAVALYIDEVYMSDSTSFVSQFIDVERVEVLKGPQGTLWGRNTTGGAVNIVTKKATLGEKLFEGYAEAGFYDSLDASSVPIRKLGGAFNLPVGDRGAVRLSVSKVEQDNYTYNLELDDPEPNQDALTVRASARFEPNDDWYLQFGVDYIDDPHHNSFLFKNRAFPGNGAQFINDLISDIGPEADTYRVRSEIEPKSDYEDLGFRFEAGWTGSDQLNIRSITSYRDLSLDRETDLDVTQAFGVNTDVTRRHDWFSQEFQGNWSNDRLDVTFGAYYFEEDIDQDDQDTYGSWPFVLMTLCNTKNSQVSEDLGLCPLVDIFLDTMQEVSGRSEYYLRDFQEGGAWDQTVALFDLGFLAANESTPFTISREFAHNESLAFYSQGTYEFSPEWSGTFGLRWTKDRKDGQAMEEVLGAGDAPVTQYIDDSFSSWTPRFALEWRPNDQAMIYGSITKGFKSGSLTSDVFENPEADPYRTSRPETVWAYELGMKGVWLDGQLEFEGAAFFYDYTDYQLAVQFENGSRIVNLPGVEVFGLEFAPVWHPVSQASIGISATYLDTEVTEFTDPVVDPFNVDQGLTTLEGKNLPYAPEWKYNLFANYTWDLQDSSMIGAGVELVHSDDYFFDPFNSRPAGGYDVVNGNVRYSSASGHWWLNVYARNITNEEYILSSFFTDLLGEVQLFAPPRTIGIQFGLDY